MKRIRFWIGYPGQRGELWLRLRSWWRQHWWPARIRQLDQERRYWEGKVAEVEADRDMWKRSAVL